ncbi:MAG TPA: nuclear transport factor 2 family protein, partial [Pyrinomonadaceae bacterium]|nr:nuclear transport factor 2 family protein [Pyrinomonadaceae bacterium]
QTIASGDSVVCYGAMSMTDGDGKSSNWTYCDIYRFRDGKIAELRSFVVMDKKEETATEASA